MLGSFHIQNIYFICHEAEEYISNNITRWRRMAITTNHPKNKYTNWYTGNFESYANTV